MRPQIQRAIESEELLFLGIVDLDCADAYEQYTRWLEESRQAGMAYLERNRQCRRDPTTLLPGARSAIIFALPYSAGDRLGEASEPKVAQYARFRDYHRILWERGENIARSLELEQYRVTVDSAPLLERALAAKTAEGFIGKNTLFIHPTHGSFLLLGEILTTAELPLDAKTPVPVDRKTKAGGCGSCDLCQVHCPTGALNRDYSIDANRCLSYWTIEHRGTIPEEFWPWLGKYYFGCDICQLACPYNRKGQVSPLPEFLETRKFPSLFDTAVMTQPEYERYFGGTPLTRAKRSGLRRNALIAMAVTGDVRLGEAMERGRGDLEGVVGETVVQIEGYIGSSQSPIPGISDL